MGEPPHSPNGGDNRSIRAGTSYSSIARGLIRLVLPKLRHATGTVPEVIDDLFRSPLFATVFGLILFVLAYTKVVSWVVALALAIAWLISVFGIARYKRVNDLSPTRQLEVIVGSAIILGLGFIVLGKSVLKQIAQQSPPSLPPSKFDNVAEGIWFGINAQASKTMVEQFRAIDPKLMQFYKGSGSVNAIDNLPSDYYDTAWRNTFARLLICNAEKGVGSAMTFVVSQHPYIFVAITNTVRDRTCVVGATVQTPPMTGGGGFVLRGGSGFWPPHAYILDLPVWNDTFGIRLFMTSGELRTLAQGYSPLWRSFAIDDPKEALELEIHRKGGSEWTPLPQLNEFLPNRITLRTDLLLGGPQIVRDYRLTSDSPRQVSRSADGFTWAFTWERTRYGEERSAFGGSN